MQDDPRGRDQSDRRVHRVHRQRAGSVRAARPLHRRHHGRHRGAAAGRHVRHLLPVHAPQPVQVPAHHRQALDDRLCRY